MSRRRHTLVHFDASSLEESQIRAESFKYANPLLDESRLIIKPLTIQTFIRQALSRVGMYSALPSWEHVLKLSKLELKASLQKKPHSLLLSILKAILLAVSLISYFGPTSFKSALDFWNTYKLPDLYSATLEEVAIGLQKGHFTSEDLTRAYLARIADVNDSLHVVIETNPHALAEARVTDNIRKRSNTKLGPFHGVPILVKDNIATARPESVQILSLSNNCHHLRQVIILVSQSYMNTTTGSYALLGSSTFRHTSQ